MAEEYHRADCIGNLNDKQQPYVVGIPMPSATLYVEHPPDMMNLSPPSDFGALKKKNSFQITSVTVQGSRLNNNNDEFADDSADDLDESHAEDLTSEILDSSKATDFDAEQSDENSNAIYDDLSPCSGPIIIAKLPSNINEPSINVGLSISLPPAFPAVGPVVSSGVTMMTSSATTPVSSQVPIINPLTDHWQHRFKVVKIVSSEPFKRGRWLCMDFMDPPAVQQDVKPETFDRGENSAALGTQYFNSQVSDMPSDNTVAHVYEIPVDQSYPGSISLAVGDQQQPQPLYGIILPVNNNQVPQVTMVHNIGTQTQLKDHLNMSQEPNQNIQANLVLNNQQVQMTADVPLLSVPAPQNQVGPAPASQVSAVSTASIQPQIPMIQPSTQASTVSIPGNAHIPLHSANGNESSFSVPSQVPLSAKNGENVDMLLKPALNIKPRGEVLPEKPFPRTNASGEDSESSQTASEKTTAADVGRDLDPDCGSAASTGTSTVAIDNKIEQAMDLVKSHLMFAVREEVEVLKEKITELLERISQLEQENDILRANASPETLNQLNQSQNKAQGKSAHSPSQGAPPHSLSQPSSS